MSLGQGRPVVVGPQLRRVAAGVDTGQALGARADAGVAQRRASQPVPPGGCLVVGQGGVAAPADALQGAHVEGDPFRAAPTGIVGPLKDLGLAPLPLRLPAAPDAADERHGGADDDGACHEDASPDLGREDVELHQVEPPFFDLRDAGVVAWRALRVLAAHDDGVGTEGALLAAVQS